MKQSASASGLIRTRLSGKCEITEDDPEGPFYRPGTPFRSRLRGDDPDGNVLIVSGRVVAPDCRPIQGALVEIWHADHRGHYDTDDPDWPCDRYKFRGKIKTPKDGRYAFTTVVPGRYKVDGQFRPAHLHFKVYACMYVPLTTQLYFADDPYLGSDPIHAVKPSLVVPLVRHEAAQGVRRRGRTKQYYTCEFTFVLSRLTKLAYMLA